MADDVVPQTGNSKNGIALWVLIAVFALPVVCSWILILNPELLPDRHSNHGMLIRPLAQLPELALDRIDGPDFSLAELHGKWTLLLVLDASCTESCRNYVHQLRQIRLATGKDRTRVELLVLYRTDPARGDLSVVRENPGMLVAGFNDPGMEVMMSVLRLAGVSERPGLVIVDPMGNMVMHYPPSVLAEDILKDLRRLLNASRDWQPELPEKINGSV